MFPFDASYLLLLFPLLLLLLLFRRLRRPLRSPPSGPLGHWLLGHSRLPLADWGPAFHEASRQHGPIFRLRLLPGFYPFVVVNDVRLGKELLDRKDFAGRKTKPDPPNAVMNPNLDGLIMQSWSPVWKELHRFTLTTLSGMGFGRARMETSVVAEADALVDAMLAMGGAAFEPEKLIQVAVSNVISKVVFDARSEIGQRSEFHETFNELLQGVLYLTVHPIYNLCPSLLKIYKTPQTKRTLGALNNLVDYIEDSIKSHEETLDPEDPRDFVDAMLLERSRTPDAAHLAHDSILHAIIDLYSAGTDTTTNAINWSIAWMLKFPEIRDELVLEVNSVLGPDGAPSLDASKRLHRLQAFVDEVLRKSCVADFTIPHSPLEEMVKIGGYDIRKEEEVLVNIWSSHHDPSSFPDPNAFLPSRFLDDDGRYKKNEDLIPFGCGVRRCIGERLARMELLFFLCRMLQRLEVRLAPGCEMPRMFGRKPFLRKPEEYEIAVVGRG